MDVSNAIGLTREIIERVRANVPQFVNRVGGISEFVALREITAELALPYCFVIPIGRKVTEERQGGSNIQKVRLLFSTIVCVDNSQRHKNSKSLTAMEQIEFLFTRMAFAFIGFDPDSIHMSTTITFVEDFLDEMTHARLWWNMVWAVEYYLDLSDPALCPKDGYVIDTVYSRGFMNGVEAAEDVSEDYNTKDGDGLMQGGDGVVDQDDI